MSEMWRSVVGIILLFLSGSGAVLFAQSRGARGIVWFILGGGAGVAGIILVLSTAVA